MKKKTYEKPTMKVVMLQQHASLLAGSINGTRSPYNNVEDVLEWE